MEKFFTNFKQDYMQYCVQNNNIVLDRTAFRGRNAEYFLYNLSNCLWANRTTVFVASAEETELREEVRHGNVFAQKGLYLLSQWKNAGLVTEVPAESTLCFIEMFRTQSSRPILLVTQDYPTFQEADAINNEQAICGVQVFVRRIQGDGTLGCFNTQPQNAFSYATCSATANCYF